MMKVLVTGGSGMVGRNLCEYLRNLNYFVFESIKKGIGLNEFKSNSTLHKT